MKKRTNSHAAPPPEYDTPLSLPKTFAADALNVVLSMAQKAVDPEQVPEIEYQAFVTIVRGDDIAFASNIPVERLMGTLKVLFGNAKGTLIEQYEAALAQLTSAEIDG